MPTFYPSKCRAHEESNTPRAVNHLQQQSQKFSVVFERKGYELYDWRTDDSIVTSIIMCSICHMLPCVSNPELHLTVHTQLLN